MQTKLQTDFGAAVTVSVTTDGKLRINDTQGRGITSVAEGTDPAGQFELNGTSTVSLGNTVQGAVVSQTDYVFDNLKTGGSTTYATGMISDVTLTRADGTTVTVDTSAQNSMTNVASTLQTQLRAAAGGSATDYTVSWDATAGKLSVSDADGRGVAVRFEGEGAGKLGGLATLDVTSDAGAQQGLADIETWIQDTLDAASALGSTQKRLGIQRDFLSKLVDALDTGIGTLVDADMTKESARLQSLQVQQQLGTQALSIANQQPQSLLSLFR
jgi:flagellin